MGFEIFEYRPDPEVQRGLMSRLAPADNKPPVFAIHAKTLIVDSTIMYIGTFNLDPRSENLNSEVGVIIDHGPLARSVETAIEIDMQPMNSWNAAANPDQHVSFLKRTRARLWQLLPIKPLL